MWVVERAPMQDARWFNGLERAVLSLDQHPKRFPVAPERVDADHLVRVLTYGRKPHTYRIFFTVDDDDSLVRVLHVRRGADPLSNQCPFMSNIDNIRYGV